MSRSVAGSRDIAIFRASPGLYKPTEPCQVDQKREQLYRVATTDFKPGYLIGITFSDQLPHKNVKKKKKKKNYKPNRNNYFGLIGGLTILVLFFFFPGFFSSVNAKQG